MSAPGIAPKVLASQIEGAAPWLMELPIPAVAIARRAPATTERWEADPTDGAYFELLLAAHFLTVATFCPTDVDSRIRHHAWVDADAERLARQLDVLDTVASWDPRTVSARTLDDTEDAAALPISGHDGEWLSVWAGALGRALMLEPSEAAAALVARIEERIEGSLDKQARVFLAIERQRDRVFDLVRACTVLAHNAGDLSRVVELWPKRPQIEPVRARYLRLGHERGDRRAGAFVRAGIINKALTAIENHRFLALRAPRALRRHRSLLLPIGPFFDDWGVAVAESPHVEEPDRAEIVEALLETHVRGTDQQGCLRALAALHQRLPGGLERIAPDLPARMRKLVAAGPVRDAIKTSRATFEGRYLAKARSAIEAAGRG
jgi:hypothetical protein